MARKSFTIRINKDDTITVRQGRQVESLSINGKTEYELVDAVRWVLIGMGAKFSFDEVYDVILLEKAS